MKIPILIMRNVYHDHHMIQSRKFISTSLTNEYFVRKPLLTSRTLQLVQLEYCYSSFHLLCHVPLVQETVNNIT